MVVNGCVCACTHDECIHVCACVVLCDYALTRAPGLRESAAFQPRFVAIMADITLSLCLM